MKRFAFVMLCAGSISMFACNKTEKTESDTAVVTENETSSADMDTRYREQASEVAGQMARDLQVDSDTALQRKASTVYYTRASRRNEARGKYTSDTTGMAAEMREIDREADLAFREMLQPEQYKVYETNRTTYYGGFEETDMPSVGYDTASSNSASAGSSSSGSAYPEGTTVTTKTEKDGDTKTEIEGPNGQTKIKTEDGKTKIKTKEKN